MVLAPLDRDLPTRDVLEEDILPAQELLDHDADPLPLMDNPVQQGDEDVAITEENEQEEDRNEVHIQELPTLPRRYPSREHRKPARFKDGCRCFMFHFCRVDSVMMYVSAIPERNQISTSSTRVCCCLFV